jgi:hypothetical protein
VSPQLDASAPYLSVTPLTSNDVAALARLWPDRVAFGDAQFTTALKTCSQLFDDDRAVGVKVLEDERLSAFGISVFLRPEFVETYLGAPHPLLGKRLLLDPHPIALRSDIAEGNAADGLPLFVLAASFDVTALNATAALGLIMQATMDLHRGYRIERFMNEAVGDANIDFLNSAGVFDFVQRFDEALPGTALRSAMFMLTRERAFVRKSPILPLFVYNPPRVLFTPSEQAVLRAALDGAPDDVISTRLRIPISATKARWTRIHERVAARLPSLIHPVAPAQDAAHRGPQVRHLILAYVRDNRSELTPYAHTRARRVK